MIRGRVWPEEGIVELAVILVDCGSAGVAGWRQWVWLGRGIGLWRVRGWIRVYIWSWFRRR